MHTKKYRMGEGDTMPPAEEFGAAAARMDDHSLAAAVADEPILADALAAIASLLRSGGR
jgi:hypothetical protein